VLDLLSAELELIVLVENGQGHPLNGILVEFSMDSAWDDGAILTPRRDFTRGGKAQATFEALRVGRAPIAARVEDLTHKVIVNVSQDGGEEP
jgi:hypothetical protein